MIYDILFAVIVVTALFFVFGAWLCLLEAWDLGGEFRITERHGRRKGFFERIGDGWKMF